MSRHSANIGIGGSRNESWSTPLVLCGVSSREDDDYDVHGVVGRHDSCWTQVEYFFEFEGRMCYIIHLTLERRLVEFKKQSLIWTSKWAMCREYLTITLLTKRLCSFVTHSRIIFPLVDNLNSAIT